MGRMEGRQAMLLTRLNYPRNAMVYGYNATGHISLAKALYVDPTGRESTLTLSDTGLFSGRDGNYNITMRNTLHGTKTYAYDSANRLLKDGKENGQSTNYNYTYAGNRKSVSGAVENGPYVYGSNSMNEITALNTGTGAVSYGYDARGNLQSRGADMFYWDYKNRLISASVGGNSVSYKYSGGDLRLARTKDGKTTLYFYHGNSLIAEKTADNKVRKIFTHDNRGVLGMTRYVYDETDTYKSKQNLYYMFDDLGSVTAITDDTGAPVQMYMYDAYGNVTNTQNDPINNFAFVGKYGGWRDWDTGLTQFLHRWYDSRDGRWLSRDPIGVEGGVNLYNYTDNNPVNRVDVAGLCGNSSNKSPLPLKTPVIPYGQYAPLATPTPISPRELAYNSCVRLCGAESLYYAFESLVYGEVRNTVIALVGCLLFVEAPPAYVGCVGKVRSALNFWWGKPESAADLSLAFVKFQTCVERDCSWTKPY